MAKQIKEEKKTSKVKTIVSSEEKEKKEQLRKKQYKYLATRRRQFTWTISFGIAIIILSLLMINKFFFWWIFSTFGFIIMAIPLLAVIKYDRRLKITRAIIKEFRSQF